MRNSGGGFDGEPDVASKRASLLSSAKASRQRIDDPTYEGPYPIVVGRHASDDDSGQAPYERPRHGRPRQQQQPQQQKESLAQFARRNAVYILSVVAVAAIAVLMLAFLRTCAPQESPRDEGGVDESETAYVSPYDWNNLDRTNDRYAYMVNGQVKSKLGIDVSEHQYEIDWEAVAADGIDFAMIRLGYRGATAGDLYLDEYYQRNLDGAKAAGVKCGVYFFSQARTAEEAVEEANYVIDQLHGTPLEYPIAFDSEVMDIDGAESRIADLDEEAITAVAEAFCSRVEAAGYRSLVYGNRADLSRFSNDFLQRRNLWWAEYDELSPSAEIDIAMWQYSHGGEVAGINTGTDMNIDLSPALNM